MLLYQCLSFLTVAAMATASAFNQTCVLSRECSEGSYCDMVTSTCTDLAQPGMACIADCHCANGVCYGGICKNCAADKDCWQNYGTEYCDLSTWKCQYKVADGSACTTSNMCFSRHCYQGTCKATSEGEPCDTAADCEGEDRYLCSPTSHTCIRRDRPDGEHCELNEQCGSGLCSNGACKKPDGSSGAVCQKNSDCKAPLVCVRDELTEKLNNEPGRKSCMSPDLPWVNPSSSGCTAPGLLCTSDNACCSKNCKWTELPLVRECA